MNIVPIKKVHNHWVFILGDKTTLDEFIITLAYGHKRTSGIVEGDQVVLIEFQQDTPFLVGVAQVFRKRMNLDETKVYFDKLHLLESKLSLEDVDINPDAQTWASYRTDYQIFNECLQKSKITSFDQITLLTEKSSLAGSVKFAKTKRQAYVRELMQSSMVDDLLGPAGGPQEEIIGMSVRDRYLVGKLAPVDTYEEPFFVAEESESEEPEDLEVMSDTTRTQGKSSKQKPASSPVEEEEDELNTSSNKSLSPSSFGMTFCIHSDVTEISVNGTWGRYVRSQSETVKNEKSGNPMGCWKRIPSGGTVTINISNKTIEPVILDQNCPAVFIRGSISDQIQNGNRLVTLFIVNNQQAEKATDDKLWIFQPEIKVNDVNGEAIFKKRPVFDIGAEKIDQERNDLELIYREKVEFAVGHGVGVHSITPTGVFDQALEIKTTVIPEYEVPVTETPGVNTEDRPAMQKMVNEGYLDMEVLASLDVNDLQSALSILTEDYKLWIDEQKLKVGSDPTLDKDTALDLMDRAEEMCLRLEEGIKVLVNNSQALEAFRFANKAMASQRIRSIFALKSRRNENPDINQINIPKNRTWRPFQLAFVLLSIPAMTDPTHVDRTKPVGSIADLLWFPTGGGKTEAYLGVAAFTMGIRRLQKDLGGYDSSRGLAVIMRYTLRLLTLQQFQRATTLLCAMEVIRKAATSKWGKNPFNIGLWVGNKSTPGTTEESHKAIEESRNPKGKAGASPSVLTNCPWCGEKIGEGRDVEVRRVKGDIGKTTVYCGDILGQCDFSRAKSKNEGIPVVVVDEEIYRRPPSMLIATVDKFAMMNWRGQVRNLFGKAEHECSRHGMIWPDGECSGNHPKTGFLPITRVQKISPIRPPDLIIQDEFHLISGPLGTMVGLYESAIDELCSWPLSDATVRPKILASTATVRKAKEQVNSVFSRDVAIFPPSGLNINDNFFSIQRPIETHPGRKYMGICSPGSSKPAVLIRVYVASLTAAQSIFNTFGSSADPYMTAVGYFNSLRDLGGMRRLAEDDVQTRSFKVERSQVARPGLAQRSIQIVDELTSRVSGKDIPKKLDQLEIQFNAHLVNGKYESRWKKGEDRAIDIVLATNMLSVGVDVNRLGLMITNGQPKNTAEYIQATSRVGRSFPGLVCTILNWTRPRDLSHYETFEHYHATFYKHVEAQSVTPFSPRALDRGLTGAFTSLVRLGNPIFNPNRGAEIATNSTKSILDQSRDKLVRRITNVTDIPSGKAAKDMLNDRIDNWIKEASYKNRNLRYESAKDTVVNYLKQPGVNPWDKVTVATSMREVEPGVKLILDDYNPSGGGAGWSAQKKPNTTSNNSSNTDIKGTNHGDK